MAIRASAVLLLAVVFSGVLEAGTVWAAAAAFALWASLARRGPSLDDARPAGVPFIPPAVALFVVVIAIVARWPIASHDVEHYPGPDEGEVVENVLEMIRAGDFNQRHRGYPGLHFYIQMVPAHLRLWSTGQTIPELSRAGFYLGARRTTLVASALSAFVVFWIGVRYLSPWSALLASTLVVISPLAFRESAVVNPDSMLSLFVCVSLLFSLRLLGHRDRASFVAAGVAMGLAGAIKYTGAFALAPYLAAWWLGRGSAPDIGAALLGATSAAVAFVVSSPYTVLNLDAFVEGLSMHASYYRSARGNAPLELSRQLVLRGVGIAAAIAAAAAAVFALTTKSRHRIVVLSYPLLYWCVFAGFERAYPRHALVLIPMAALLAADGVEQLVVRAGRVIGTVPAGVAAAVSVLALPTLDTARLRVRTSSPTPADRALEWAMEILPDGSRILTDQYTPAFPEGRFRVHRLRVEEKRFVGNYDWVFRSGYPPGLDPSRLREVVRFDTERALGDPIVVYQVPARDLLMPARLGGDEDELVLGAGELLYFGSGWEPPTAGAFDTSRISRGQGSEIYFSLAEPSELVGEMRLEALGSRLDLALVLNGSPLRELTVPADSEQPQWVRFEIPERMLATGLNRLVVRYSELVRLDRRRPGTAIRLYALKLTKRRAASIPTLSRNPSRLR